VTIKYLHIFDFDGTLFRSPERPAWWREKGWWGKHESLSPPCVPEKPGSDWWVESTVSAAKKAISDAESYAVLITGRLAGKFHARVFELLSQVGLRFDETHLTPGGGTLPHKLRVIEDLIKRLPIEKVEIWEDRSEHVGAFKSVIEQFGKESEIHLVSTHAHALECPPPEESMAERVVARFLTAVDTDKGHVKWHASGHVAWVDMIFIPPEKRRQGEGTKLYKEWEAALPHSIKLIRLLAADTGHGTSEAFWEHLGFAFAYDAEDSGDLTYEQRQEMVKGVHGTPTPAPVQIEPPS